MCAQQGQVFIVTLINITASCIIIIIVITACICYCSFLRCIYRVPKSQLLQWLVLLPLLLPAIIAAAR
jgi:ABC-type Fe3+ transport system permease subunit